MGANYVGQWLEAGVGTGRFARSLGIDIGIDLSVPMLGIAKSKGATVSAGSAAALPFANHSFDGVILVLTLCFIADSNQALRECGRVLRPEGKLVPGEIPAGSAWGRAYEIKGGKGHPVYASARFYSVPEIVGLVEGIGFAYRGSASTLFWSYGSAPEMEPVVQTGVSREAGFIGLLFEKTQNPSA
jgi:ubiquinone/menaquinone biosynthesis C-methylase UbiE